MPDTPSLFERLTKPLIVISVLAAVGMQLWLLDEPLPRFWVIASATFIAAWACGRWRPTAARRATLFLTYLIPLFFIAAFGEFPPSAWVVWIVMLYGVMFSTRASFGWSLPRMWRAPLAHWGVLVALTWPIIMLRESDFELWRVPSAFGAVSAEAALFVITGILWFDWLFSQYSADDRAAFVVEVIWPLGIGWMIAACLGVYQMFGRIDFLNPPFWAGLRRATGSLGDANLLGIVSALWGPVLVAVASALATKTWRWMAAGGLPLSWLAVWASGSRSSMPIVVLGTVGILYGLWNATKSKRLIVISAVALLLVAGAAAVGAMRAGASVAGPVSRLIEDLQPRWSTDWVRSAARYLWTRNGYGLIAGDMIRQSPFVGIGIGAFNPLVFLYSWQRFHLILPSDNAQNWFRHQLAELGVIGSVGWMIWCGSFLALLITARERADHLSGTVLRLILIGFGLISLVGVPAQDIVVVLTFWTFAFWFVGDIGRWRRPGEESRSSGRLTWALLWLLVFVHAGGTVKAALTYLRPPNQALRANMDYSVGFYEPEDDSAFRWTRQRAVAVLTALKPWMELTVRASHAVPTEPVDVKVWVNQKLALRMQLASADPITRYFPAGDGGKRMMLETWVSRVDRPRERGQDDPRDLGLLVRWDFVDAPPGNAAIDKIH
jgi:hypothetical protein